MFLMMNLYQFHVDLLIKAFLFIRLGRTSIGPAGAFPADVSLLKCFGDAGDGVLVLDFGGLIWILILNLGI